jgi:hypothetical protein
MTAMSKRRPETGKAVMMTEGIDFLDRWNNGTRKIALILGGRKSSRFEAFSPLSLVW